MKISNIHSLYEYFKAKNDHDTFLKEIECLCAFALSYKELYEWLQHQEDCSPEKREEILNNHIQKEPPNHFDKYVEEAKNLIKSSCYESVGKVSEKRFNELWKLAEKRPWDKLSIKKIFAGFITSFFSGILVVVAIFYFSLQKVEFVIREDKIEVEIVEKNTTENDVNKQVNEN